ncbi:hypothetical protein MMAN_00310 [Mycobacterium mantenii]|uniref:Uncharacterized protein n=1 Tax=Mycobacterium mantenii TaxID=560555 RepID=A0ABM7JKE4_MYCNT|nr:hypothetical protein MMAN_00310 [Mycobacterium mantenii]
MTDDALNSLRLELFGPNVPVSRAYIDALLQLTESASARVGVTKTATDRVAYWLDGSVLGELSCTGASDEDAEIKGRLTRLAELPSIKVDIAVEYDNFTRVSRIGRVLTLELSEDRQVVLDGTRAVRRPNGSRRPTSSSVPYSRPTPRLREPPARHFIVVARRVARFPVYVPDCHLSRRRPETIRVLDTPGQDGRR